MAPDKKFKLVVTYRQVWVNGTLAKEGDVITVGEDDMKTMLGLGRGRLFDPEIDGKIKAGIQGGKALVPGGKE